MLLMIDGTAIASLMTCEEEKDQEGSGRGIQTCRLIRVGRVQCLSGIMGGYLKPHK